MCIYLLTLWLGNVKERSEAVLGSPWPALPLHISEGICRVISFIPCWPGHGKWDWHAIWHENEPPVSFGSLKVRCKHQRASESQYRPRDSTDEEELIFLHVQSCTGNCSLNFRSLGSKYYLCTNQMWSGLSLFLPSSLLCIVVCC